ncbi:hypothetical protein GOV12_07655 [Candidatus Pacearchaeota archaeon]|nr:hypothetical protein [Candidatus Pacearchaeota archaeon]
MKNKKRVVKNRGIDKKLLILYIVLTLLIIGIFTLVINYNKFVIEEDFLFDLPSVGIFGEIDSGIFDYSSSTPANNTIIDSGNIEAGFVVNKDNINYLKYQFNETNYSLYDDSLVLILNFDEVSSLGEDVYNVIDNSKINNNGKINGGTDNEFIRNNNGNPFLAEVSAGRFDYKYLQEPFVLFINNKYHLWYEGSSASANAFKIGYATSDDGIFFTRENNGVEVLNNGNVGKFDSSSVGSPSIIFNDSTYLMWYTGANATSKQIGYATSIDGITWTRMNNGEPVLKLGDIDKFDSRKIENPSVIFKDGLYHMWYQGSNYTTYNIGYATSIDGITWTRMNNRDPIMELGESGKFDDRRIYSPDVSFLNDKYYMYYSGWGTNHKVGLVTSFDGITWTRENNGDPIMELGESGKFDSVQIKTPHIMKNNDYLFLYYTGYGGVINTGFRSGVAKKLFKQGNFLQGRYDKSLSFDGTNDYVTFPNKPEYDLTSDYSISVWINKEENPNYRTSEFILTKSNDTHTDLAFRMDSSNKYAIGHFKSDSNFVSLTSNSSNVLNKWEYVSVQKNNGEFKIFINGKLDASGISQGTNGDMRVSNRPLYVGKTANTNPNNFAGRIDNLKVWNRALSDDEVMIDYLSNLNKYDVSGWNFYINQTKLNGELLDYGTYLFNGFIEDSVGTKYEADKRFITLGVEPVTPVTPVNPVNPGPGGGGPSNPSTPSTPSVNEFFTKTFYVNESSLLNGYSNNLEERFRVIFNKNNKNDSFGILDITNEYVKINMSYISGNALFEINDEGKFDLNNDDYYDISLKLNSIRFGKSNFTIIGINEEINENTPNENQPIILPYENPEIPKNNDSLLLFIILFVILAFGIIFVIVFVIFELKRKNKPLINNVRVINYNERNKDPENLLKEKNKATRNNISVINHKDGYKEFKKK